MIRATRTAAACCLLIAAATALRAEEAATAAVTPVWEVHADLTAESLSGLRKLIQRDADGGDSVPAISFAVHGFKNPATPAEDDWLVLLDLGDRIDQAWAKLLGDFKEEWGTPDELGRWIINDADAGLSFVLARRLQALAFTNAVENLGVIPPSRLDSSHPHPLRGHIDLEALGRDRTESDLLRLAETLAFGAKARDDAAPDDGIRIDIAIRLINPDQARQVRDAFAKALDSEWTAMLPMPIPALASPEPDKAGNLNLTLQLDAEQTKGAVSAIILHISKAAQQPDAAPPSEDDHAHEPPQR